LETERASWVIAKITAKTANKQTTNNNNNNKYE
jgi:hypothetical protein